MDIAAYVHETLKAAGHPVESIVTPVLSDRATWRVLLLKGSTAQQQAAADGAMAALTIDASSMSDSEANGRIDGDKLVKAIVIWAANRFGITPAQARTAILAIYRGL